MTTILPPWSEYRKTVGVETKEPVETFDWILDTSFAHELKTAKVGMDSIEGSRAFLEAYVPPLSMKSNPMLHKILCAMGDHHSGNSSRVIMNTYMYLLKNWDIFVEETKEREQRKSYDAQQIRYGDYDEYLDAYKRSKTSLEEEVKFYELCSIFRAKFNVLYSNDEMTDILTKLRDEENKRGMAKVEAMDKRRFDEEIELLTFLYRAPIRWFSYKGGISTFSVTVTSQHIKRMREIYPDYKDHYMAVKNALNEWSCLFRAEVKTPSSSFFEAFAPPEVSEEDIERMTLIHSDYAEHIKTIADTRASLLENEVRSVMLA